MKCNQNPWDTRIHIPLRIYLGKQSFTWNIREPCDPTRRCISLVKPWYATHNIQMRIRPQRTNQRESFQQRVAPLGIEILCYKTNPMGYFTGSEAAENLS